jgi:hypothetical protein
MRFYARWAQGSEAEQSAGVTFEAKAAGLSARKSSPDMRVEGG